jgi:hypothetical protein
MNMPGFTAEASLFKSGRSYGMSAPFKVVELRSTVQMSRATGPFGPIGLPGQGCEARMLAHLYDGWFVF